MPSESPLLTDLNDAQREAVQTTEGPLLVIAGAGSGKTRVLTNRIAYLIREKGVRPDNILAVTFTNKAAREMKERISALLASEQSAITNFKGKILNQGLNDQNSYESTLEHSDTEHLLQIKNLKLKIPAALPLVGTFHSVCVRFLHRDIHHLGYENSFTIYDAADSEALMKKIIRAEDLDEKRFAPRAVLGSISRAKNLLIDEDRFRAGVDSYFDDMVSRLYPMYQKELKKNQALDFDDLICKMIEVFQKFPDILERYQNRFIYLSVDEYQDTNYAQYTLTKLLAEKYRNLCVIGDDWQSIYSWRGADMTNILNFEKDYPEAKVVKLEQNYRSTQTIVEAANHVIKHNKSRTDKTLWTEKVTDDKIEIYEAESEREEGAMIVRMIAETMKRGRMTNDQLPMTNKIQSMPSTPIGGQKHALDSDRGLKACPRLRSGVQSEMQKEGSVIATLRYSEGEAISDEDSSTTPYTVYHIPYTSPRYSDFAILYRTNAQSRVLEEAFLRWGIPHKIVGGVGFYERKEIKDVLAYMRLIYNPVDSINFVRIINTPPRKIGATTIETLGNYAAKYDLTLIEAIHRASEILELNAGTKNRLMTLDRVLKDFMERKNEFSAAALMKYVLSIVEYKAFLMDGTEEGEQRWGNVQELVTVASKYDGLEPGISLATFLEEVALVAQTDKLAENEDGVVLMTLHNAKGLEFPTVFITGLEEGVLPHSQSTWTESELEEERRLMYVGITRARDKLYLLHATSRQFYGNTNYNAPSRFLSEIPEECTSRPQQYSSFPGEGARRAEGVPGEAPRRSLPQTRSGGEGVWGKGVGTKLHGQNIETREKDLERISQFRDGDPITHRSWGEGVIVNVRGDMATVAFKDPKVGIKKLAINIAPIERMDANAS